MKLRKKTAAFRWRDVEKQARKLLSSMRERPEVRLSKEQLFLSSSLSFCDICYVYRFLVSEEEMVGQF